MRFCLSGSRTTINSEVYFETLKRTLMNQTPWPFDDNSRPPAFLPHKTGGINSNGTFLVICRAAMSPINFHL